MKQYSRIFGYLKNYKGQVLLYFLFIVLSILFSIVSIGMLAPFFDLIFKGDSSSFTTPANNPATEFLRKLMVNQVSHLDPVRALAIICVIIIVSIFLKNLFLYLSYYVLNPLKNTIVNTLRAELYNKILQLPIGYFTEKRKGDLISRTTNDISEVETSVIGTLEGWVRDPLTILVNFAVLFYISPQITLAILLCIPVISFVLGAYFPCT